MIKLFKFVFTLAIIYFLYLFTATQNVYFASALVIVVFVYELNKEIGDKRKDRLKIALSILVFFTITTKSIYDYFHVEIVKTEDIYEISQSDKNTYFHTTLNIKEPIVLKIKDTYSNLAYKTDYDCVDKYCYIAYLFGNNVEDNKKVGLYKGLVFTYKAIVLRGSEEDKKYQESIQDFNKTRKDLEKSRKPAITIPR